MMNRSLVHYDIAVWCTITCVTRRELLLASSATALSAQTQARPNILFIMVDEMRWDAMSSEHHPVVATPNLDRLAKQGVRFTNAYTVAPVCSPSRACTFTGRYADVVGVTANGVPAHPGEVFLPSILKHHGYHTAIAGKLHYTPARFSYGFDQFWSFTREGPAPELGYMSYLERKHGSPRKFPIVPGTCPWPDDELGRDVGIFKYPEEDFETEWITDRSLEYLRSRKEKQQPWFLFSSYLKPHSPSVEPKRYFEKYDPAAIPVPKLPPNIKQIRAAQEGQGKRRFIDDERMLRVMSAAYYGAIAHIDDHVGKLLAELDRLGMADNTLVLFTADHGNMLGDRGRMFKGVMYEGSSHVPLIWREPKPSPQKRGGTEAKIIENTDLLPTILEAAGLPVPQGIQGRSFLKLARGAADNTWKDLCYSQLATAMVRTPRFKFIDQSRDLSRDFELYDMRNDPKEERNLAGEAKHRDAVEGFKRQLAAWRRDKPAPVRIPGMDVPDYAS
ncbi:MAG: DUF4976 domain-containing protein [Bryobacterales bacterium]|nr:DUF4976 domain-containing protein [Bryobacterales bacterium]